MDVKVAKRISVIVAVMVANWLIISSLVVYIVEERSSVVVLVRNVHTVEV